VSSRASEAFGGGFEADEALVGLANGEVLLCLRGIAMDGLPNSERGLG